LKSYQKSVAPIVAPSSAYIDTFWSACADVA
jgi:hypothetical protein